MLNEERVVPAVKKMNNYLTESQEFYKDNLKSKIKSEDPDIDTYSMFCNLPIFFFVKSTLESLLDRKFTINEMRDYLKDNTNKSDIEDMLIAFPALFSLLSDAHKKTLENM